MSSTLSYKVNIVEPILREPIIPINIIRNYEEPGFFEKYKNSDTDNILSSHDHNSSIKCWEYSVSIIMSIVMLSFIIYFLYLSVDKNNTFGIVITIVLLIATTNYLISK